MQFDHLRKEGFNDLSKGLLKSRAQRRFLKVPVSD